MRKNLFWLVCFCALLGSGFGAVAPLFQSIREINAILESKELPRYFTPGDRILEISRVENTFVIKSEEKEVIVDLEYTPSTKIGPFEFKLHFRPDGAK